MLSPKTIRVLAGVCTEVEALATVFASSAVLLEPIRNRQAKHNILTFIEVA